MANLILCTSTNSALYTCTCRCQLTVGRCLLCLSIIRMCRSIFVNRCSAVSPPLLTPLSLCWWWWTPDPLWDPRSISLCSSSGHDIKVCQTWNEAVVGLNKQRLLAKNRVIISNDKQLKSLGKSSGIYMSWMRHRPVTYLWTRETEIENEMLKIF